ncbi:glycoside hydrolase family 2 TIM barrel-domain containing protein [Mucilaginibacter terrae]|uniref:Beta-galactosidase n=1 Tax=Mucilaginibacter terrae TaxID=1955052 RepID=A0ABU3GWE0_9SPHI|nr:glycoside hydrolase family 2 TIM barrel-domain containing protein [Mucilaginibacter terrae]MDT3404086.1 beta-galactosidase [Mucilaginibacter terrae]
MKKIYLFISLLLATASLYAQQSRIITPFDDSWLFYKGDATGAEQTAFNDKAWRKLSVPHDWSIEGPYDQANPTSRGGGYLPAGIGWYRKQFTLGKTYASKNVTVEFDGVMANSDVWVNGHHLGKRPYGYISFIYDLTPYISYDKPNVIAVKADNSLQTASRYYTGAGIYRHVRLVAYNTVHFAPWSVYVKSPVATVAKATVQIQAQVVNSTKVAGEYKVTTTVLDAAGKTVSTAGSAKTVAAGQTVDFSFDAQVANPKLWNLDEPYLYTAVTRIAKGSEIIDEVKTPVGIREAKFEAATGFWLNGQNIKIKGVCLHHDGGAVGAAVPLSVWEQRFKLLKQAGVNGIRTAHNPVAPEFLDLCDRMGFVVMDETFDTWTASKPGAAKGYNLYFTEWWERDTRDMVMRDRNHPSIVLYSVGNEIHDSLKDSVGFKKYRDQQNLIHKLDPGRPVTMALFRPNVSGVYANGFADMMDVVGQNYRENELIAAHEAHPNWKVIGTENTHVLSMWLALRDKPYMAGQFLWTGIDYLGEAAWPETTNNQGLFTRTGEWKQQGLQRQSWWSEKPVVHMVRKSDNDGAGNWVADWTPVDFGTYDNAKVQVYSNCDEVELFLNGKSQGIKPKPADDSPRDWDLTFEKGSLKAVGRNKGKEVAVEEFKSAGAPAKILLTATQDKLTHNFDDASIVKVSIVDAEGNVCANADNMVKFSISGSGILQAVDNGDIISHEQYQGTEHKAFQGKCIAIVKAGAGSGTATLKVSVAGLPEASIALQITK